MLAEDRERLLGARASGESSFTVSSAAPSGRHDYEEECDRRLEEGDDR